MLHLSSKCHYAFSDAVGRIPMQIEKHKENARLVDLTVSTRAIKRGSEGPRFFFSVKRKLCSWPGLAKIWALWAITCPFGNTIPVFVANLYGNQVNYLPSQLPSKGIATLGTFTRVDVTCLLWLQSLVKNMECVLAGNRLRNSGVYLEMRWNENTTNRQRFNEIRLFHFLLATWRQIRAVFS